MRDIFIFIVTAMPEYKEWLIDKHKLVIKGKNVKDQIYVLAEMFNFQNTNDIQYAFDLLVDGNEFFKQIGELVIPVLDDNEKKVKKFSLNKSFPKWFEYLNYLINTRHRIVHDSNYRLELDEVKFDIYQESLLCFSQMFSLYIIGKFNLPYLALHYDVDKESIPYFLRLKDYQLDWELVE